MIRPSRHVDHSIECYRKALRRGRIDEARKWLSLAERQIRLAQRYSAARVYLESAMDAGFDLEVMRDTPEPDAPPLWTPMPGDVIEEDF